MSGKELKEILKNEGISVAELTRLLGLNSEQATHSLLKADDVKSGLLEKIATVTNKSVCAFYHNLQTENSSDEFEAIDNAKSFQLLSSITKSLLSEISAQRKVTEKAQEQIDKVISLLENKLCNNN